MAAGTKNELGEAARQGRRARFLGNVVRSFRVNDMPLLMDVADQFRDKPVEWLSVHTPNLKTFEELDRGIATCRVKSWNKRKLPFTTVLDRPVTDGEYSGQTSQRYGVVEWPTLIVVDQHGEVVGPVPKNKLAQTIAHLLDTGTEE